MPRKVDPVLRDTVHEVRGSFADDAALQDAIGRLTRAGFDRAQISVPVPSPDPGQATPDAGAETPMTEDDMRQLRNLGSATAAAAGAMLAAGATVLTGGAAGVAIAAAAAGGIAAGGGVEAATSSVEAARKTEHAERAAEGELILAVTVQKDEDPARAEALMKEAGATRVAQGER